MNAPATLLALFAGAILATPASGALVTITSPDLSFVGSSGWMGITPPALFTTGDVVSYSFTYDSTVTASVLTPPPHDPDQRSIHFNSNPITSVFLTVSRGGMGIYQAEVNDLTGITFNNLTYSYYPSYGITVGINFGEPTIALAPNPTIADTTYEGAVMWVEAFYLNLSNPGVTTTGFDLTPGNTFTLGELLGNGSALNLSGASIRVLPGNGSPTPYNYTFSQPAVPEPSAALLGAIGIVGLLRRRR
ncbi:MAG TPA: hypothetical protein VGE67_19575 [Haloferula sp.]